jgi:hypothetical protein
VVRSLRLLVLAVFALLVSAFARPAFAANDPAPAMPRDVPAMARGAIPPLPADYVTKQLGWLDLSYPAAAGERVASLVEEANAFKAKLTHDLGQPVLEHVTVRVAPTASDMARLAPADAPPPEYASGVAYNGLHFVLLTMLPPRGAEAVDLDEVFRHELAHVALEDALQERHVPLWFNEGLAIYLSGELAVARTQTLWGATLSDRLIPLADLDRNFPRESFSVNTAYAEAADFVSHLMRKTDHARFVAMIERIRDGQPFDRAIADAYATELRHLEFEWRGGLERRFSVIPVLTGGALVWVVAMAALVVAYVRRRRRSKAILERWAREEAIEDARIAARLAAERAARGEVSLAAVPAHASATKAVDVKIERDGGWHTLH